MSGVSLPLIRVRALQPKRRRAGLDFGREPVDLAPGAFGTGLAGAIAFAAVLADPLLAVVMVVDGEEQAVTDDDRAQVAALIEAEGAKVDPANPPTDDAATAKAEEERLAAEAAADAEDKAKGRQSAAKAKD